MNSDRLLPTRIIVRTIAGRSLRLWAITRLALSFFFALGGNDPLRLSRVTVLAIVGLTTLLGLIEMRKQREQYILANAGVSPLVIAGMLCLPSLIGEFILMTIGRL